MRSDHRHLTAYQIGCEVGQSVGLVLRPAILDRHILSLDVAGLKKALAECGQIAFTINGCRAAEAGRTTSLNSPESCQPSPIWQSGRPVHCPFRGLLGIHSRYGLHTRSR